MKRLIIIFSVVLLSACSSVKLLTPTQADVDRVSGKYNGYTLADLNAGKALFEQKCTQCHRLRDPARKTADEWIKIVPEMAQKADKKKRAKKIDSNEQKLILQYLITMSAAQKQGK